MSYLNVIAHKFKLMSFPSQVSGVAVRAAVGDVGADVALLPGAVLPLGLALPPAAQGNPPPQGHVQAQGKGGLATKMSST